MRKDFSEHVYKKNWNYVILKMQFVSMYEKNVAKI